MTSLDSYHTLCDLSQENLSLGYATCINKGKPSLTSFGRLAICIEILRIACLAVI